MTAEMKKPSDRAMLVDNVAERAAPVSTRDAQRIAKRESVLNAAIAVFAARGFEGTSLPAISAACSVPVPLIVYHFRSKDQLWRDSVAEVYRRIEAHIAQYDDEIAKAEGPDFYRAHIRAHVTAIAAHPEYMRILFQEGTHHSDRLVWLVEQHQNRMTALLTCLIERGQKEGHVPPIDPIHAKFIFSGAFVLPIVLAPEYRLVSSSDPLGPEFVEHHIETCLQILLPSLAANLRASD